MESSHNLILLFTLSSIFFFFPTTIAYTKCVCTEIAADGSSHVYTRISESNQTASQASTNQGSNQNQQVPTGQQGRDASQNTGSRSAVISNQGPKQSNSPNANSQNSQGAVPNNNQGNIQNSQGSTNQNSQSTYQGTAQNSQSSTSQSSQSTKQGTIPSSQGSTNQNSQSPNQGTPQNSQGSTNQNSQSTSQSSSQGTTQKTSNTNAPNNNQGFPQGSTNQNSNKGQGAAQSSTQINQGGTNVNINLKGSFSKVFAFGDSYTDTGNAGFLGSHPAQQNQSHPNDGGLIIDYLTNALGLPPLPCYKNSSVKNFTNGANFAIAGATALSKEYFNQFARIAASFFNATPVSFQTEIDWFNNFLNQLGCKQKDNCKSELENALFWLGGMGGDDHARSAGSPQSLQWLKEKSVAHISSVLQELLKNGAKYVVVQGLPPLGCSTMEVSMCPLKNLNKLGCSIAANAATMAHNQVLQKTLETFRQQYPNAQILYGDLWSAFLHILQNAEKFAIQETVKACCGAGGNLNFNIHSFCGAPGTNRCADAAKYIFWDGVHFTATMNKYLTHLLISEGFTVPAFTTMVATKLGKLVL